MPGDTACPQARTCRPGFAWQYMSAATSRRAPWGNSTGRHQATGVAHHLLLPLEGVPLTLLPGDTRSTWAYPIHYRPALAFSILSRPLPLSLSRACGVGLPGNRPGGIPAAFPCSAFTTRWVRSTLYTGGATFASGYVRQPEPDRWPYFGLSLNQPRMAHSL